MDPQAIVKSLEPFPSKGARSLALSAASTGFLPPYNEPSCRGISSGVGVGTQLETVAVASVASAVPVVGNLLSSFSGLLTGHHAAAVRQEQATLCQAVPAASAFLQQIDALVETGQITPATAAAALDQGFQNWRASVKSILKDTGGHCNAACCYEKYFQAAILKRKSDYLGRGQGTQAATYTQTGAVSAPTAGGLPGSTAAPALQSVLVQAGLTPSSQHSLATAVLVGGGVLVGVVLFSILTGGK